jgi:CubicO group peptidase (beta-lactamase class C family)
MTRRRRSDRLYMAALSLACSFSSLVVAQESAPVDRPRDAAPQTVPDDVAAKIDAIFKSWATLDGPGAAVGVYRGGVPIFMKGYGAANLEHRVPIDAATAFDLASTSKQFAAACVALLALDGKLDLDDPIRKHVPSLPEWAATTTIRHCVHHTSGVRDYIALLMFRGKSERDHVTDREALEILARQKALGFPAGTKHEYSNSGYFLLSQVVRAASGESLAAFAKRRLFDPLGMTATRFLDDQTVVVPKRATAYAPEGKSFAINMSDWEQTGDGAVLTNLADLGKWIANFDSGAVGGPKFLELMNSRGALDDGTPLRYGFGLFHEKDGVIAHGGAWAGYRSELLRVPGEDLAVAVLCNRADADASGRAEKVLKIAREAGLGSKKTSAVDDSFDAAEGLPGSPSTRAATSRPKSPTYSAEDLEAFAGSYRSEEIDAVWKIETKVKSLRLLGPGDNDLVLFPQAQDVFGSFAGVVLRFDRAEDGRPSRFTVRLRGVDGLVFVRE